MDIKHLPCVVAIAAGISLVAGPMARAQDNVTLSLNWIPGGNHVGFYAAQQQGFYRDENLDVAIQRGYGSGDTVKRVATGAAQIGVADSASVLVGRSHGLNVKQIGVLFGRSADAIFFLADSGISKPKDLEGRTLGGTTGETTLNLVPVFASKAGFDVSKVQIVNIANSAKASSLGAKTIDSIVGFVNEEPTFKSAVERAGLNLKKFTFSDFGIDYYSIGLIASDELLSKNPNLLRRVLRATLKGYAFAIENPQGAVAALTNALPEVNPGIALEQWNIAKSLILTDSAKRNGLGWIDANKMAETIKLLKDFQKVDDSIVPSDIYTMNVMTKVLPN